MNINERLKSDVACNRYGASMGRRDWRVDCETPCKFHLQRVRFVDGCYDLGGAYWGAPADLWCAWDEDPPGCDEQARMFVRASNREAARAAVLEHYPNARFFQ